jgi:hypothetical protein
VSRRRWKQALFAESPRIRRQRNSLAFLLLSHFPVARTGMLMLGQTTQTTQRFSEESH